MTHRDFYDLSGKLIRVEMPSQTGGKSVILFGFDDFDRLISKALLRENEKGQITATEDSSSYTYSPQLDRVLLTSANNGVEKLNFAYDQVPPFKTVSYGVAAADPKNPLGLIQDQYEVSYDPSNRIASIADGEGQSVFTATHDSAGRLLSIDSGDLFGNRVTPLSVALSYDGYGRKISSIAKSGWMTTRSSVQYDLLNRVSDLTWNDGPAFGLAIFSGGMGKVEETLSYDPVGNVLTQTREFGKLVYGYDPTNELAAVQASSDRHGLFSSFANPLIRGVDRDYHYDLNGNRTQVQEGERDGDHDQDDRTPTGDSTYINNQITQGPSLNYQSDADGFGSISAEIPKGRIGLARNYTYRGDRKLASLSVSIDSKWKDDPSVLEEITQANYFYDAIGRRVAKQITVKHWQPCFGFRCNGRQLRQSSTFTQTYSYLVKQNKILLAKSGDGVETLYLDGQGIDEHLGEVSAHGTKAFVTDHLGSVLNSPLAGAFRSYGAFGESQVTGVIVPSAYSADPVLYGFAGRQFDLESGKYYNRARMYDPATGRFMQQDPIGIRGGLNLYRYSENNPILLTDPLGTDCGQLNAGWSKGPETLIIAAIAYLIGRYLYPAAINWFNNNGNGANPNNNNNGNNGDSGNNDDQNDPSQEYTGDYGDGNDSDVAIIDGSGQVVWSEPGSGYDIGSYVGDGSSYGDSGYGDSGSGDSGMSGDGAGADDSGD